MTAAVRGFGGGDRQDSGEDIAGVAPARRAPPAGATGFAPAARTRAMPIARAAA